MTDPSPKTSEQLPEIQRLIGRLCELWGIKGIEDEITIEFSSRLTRSLGRTKPIQKVVRLNLDLLADLSSNLEEVLCHEIAHIATVYKYGESTLPHGIEWRGLVRQAGFEPKVRIYVPQGKPSRPSAGIFLHTCPVCFSRRTAKRRMSQWRCGSCVSDGLPGELLIEEVL